MHNVEVHHGGRPPIASFIKLSSQATNNYWEIPVLFEDDHLLALDKPAELPSSPDAANPDKPNLMALLHGAIEKNAVWVRERKIEYLANANRLEPEATGVILLAKDKPALLDLANQFGNEKPCKIFIGLVCGRPKKNSFRAEQKLTSKLDVNGQVRSDSHGGKKAVTQFDILENFSRHTLLKCQPLTDKLHQIRVHLSRQRLPLAGDMLYGGSPLNLSSLKSHYRLKRGKTEKPLIGRPALHCHEIHVTHPITRQEIIITAPLPKDFLVSLKYLRRYATALHD